MKSFSVLALTAVLTVPCFANVVVSASPAIPYPRAGKNEVVVAASPAIPYPRAGKNEVVVAS
jgi:hypothetical protein